MSVFGVILVSIFPAFGLNTERYTERVFDPLATNSHNNLNQLNIVLVLKVIHYNHVQGSRVFYCSENVTKKYGKCLLSNVGFKENSLLICCPLKSFYGWNTVREASYNVLKTQNATFSS